MNSSISEIGSFLPGRPPDSLGVLRLFAIASRVVCAKPENYMEVTKRLSDAVSELMPPESLAAKDCAHLWQVFSRFAAHPKPMLRVEAGKAFCRDLDFIGQQLQLPPLPGWERLPEYLVEASDLEEKTSVSPEDALKAARARARKASAALASGEALKAPEVASILRSIDRFVLEEALLALVDGVHLSRGELSLLVRWLSTDNELESDDDLLMELLGQVGDWLIK